MTPPDRSWSSRGAILSGVVALLVLLAGFGAWSVTASIAGAIIAPGQVEVEQNRQAVQHPEGGLVAALLVAEGDRVAQGDILLRLDAADAQSALSVAAGQLHELRARHARLRAEQDAAPAIAFAPDLLTTARQDDALAEILAGQRRLFAARRETLAQEVAQMTRRRDQIASQIDGITAQHAALSDELALIRTALAAQHSLLARGLVQGDATLSLGRDVAQAMGRLGALTASIAEAEGRMTEIDLAILSLSTQRREDAIAELREVRVVEEELAERVRGLTRRINRLDLRAPVAGVVHGLTVFGPQTVIRAADPVLYLVPQDRPLVISVRIAPMAIDQVAVGQDVLLRFPGLGGRMTPDITGRVTQVSADTFIEPATGARFYRADIAPHSGELARLGGQRLLPGMLVEAFITTGDRTPMAYLLAPLTDYFHRAFREG